MKYQTYSFKNALLIALIFLLSSCGSSKNSHEQYSDFSQGTMEKDKYFAELIKAYPDADEAWMERSVPYNKRGEFEEGMKYLDQAVSLNPHLHQGYRGYVKLYMLHDYEGSLKDFQEYLAISNDANPVCWGENLYKLIGLNYLLLNNNDSAVYYLDKGIQMTTDEFGKDYVEQRSYLYKAKAHFNLNENQQALDALNSTLEVENRFPEAHFLKAVIYKNRQQWSEADSAIQRAATLFQKYKSATNAYYEMPLQLYQSQIDSLAASIDRHITKAQ